MGFWIAPSGDKTQNVEVVTQTVPPGITATEFADMTLHGLRSAIGSKNVHAFRQERICNGNADGWYIESSVTIGITPVIAEQTLGVAESQAYVATYRRPASAAENAAARQALDTLCPGAA